MSLNTMDELKEFRDSLQTFCIIQDGRIVFVNSSFCDFVGYSEEELLSKENLDFLLRDRDLEDFYKKLQEIISGSIRSKPFSTFIQTKDSGPRYIEINPALIDFHNKPALEVTIYDRSSISLIKGFFEHREKYLNDILNNPLLAFNIVDSKGYIVFFNEGSQKLTGYASYEVLGKHYKILYPEDIDSSDNTDVIVDRDERGAKIVETLYRHKKGYLIPILLHINPLEDENKNITSHLGVALDITELKKSREEIDKRNKELLALVRLSEAITKTLDLEKTVQEILVSIHKIFEIDYVEIFLWNKGGFDSELPYAYSGQGNSISYKIIQEHFKDCEICEKERGIFCPIYFSTSDSSEIKIICPKEISVLILPLLGKQKYLGALCFYKFEGKKFTREDDLLLSSVTNQAATAIDNAIHYESQKEDAELIGAINEITLILSANLDPDRLGEEIVKHLRNLTQTEHVSLSSFDPYQNWYIQSIASIDEETQIFDVHSQFQNDPILEMINTGKSIEWSFKDDGNLISEIIQKFIQTGFKRVIFLPILSEGRVTGSIQMATRNENGFTERLLKHLNSFMNYITLSLRNAHLVADLGHAYDMLKHAQDIIVRTERLRALGEMSAGVAHDFNNMLGAILARSQMLKSQTDNKEILKGLDIIEKAARDGAETVLRLQEFTRTRKDHNFEPINLNELIKDVLSMTSSRWRKDFEIFNVKTQIKMKLETIPPILGNASELREAMMNICLNAFDAMPNGGILTVKTFFKSQKVFASIQDTGTGMSNEVLSRIFDPFFTTKGAKGSGLGMSLVYGIVKRHSGHIEIESEIGVGTKITFTFPPAKVEDTKTPTAESVTVKSEKSRILVIDDNPEIAQLIQDILKNEGHSVDPFPNGEEGINAFKSKKYDLVISDLGLPTISGWDVAKMIKEISPQTPFLLVTGWGVQINDEDLIRYKIDFIITKPFDMLKLVEIVNQALASNKSLKK